MTTRPEVIAGCEAISHRSGSEVGVVVVHGFTSSPYSMHSVCDALIGAGFDVEVPLLRGHGTNVDDMTASMWSDWSADVDAAIDALEQRVERTVFVGQSMGATLVLAAGLRHPESAGLVCVNPMTRLPAPDLVSALEGAIAGGIEWAPGEGSDIAADGVFDRSYGGTPLRALRSLLRDGVDPLAGRFGELAMPLRLFTSRQDHVVRPADSEHLAAHYGGPVQHTWLEHSFHVATLDLDRDVIAAGAVEFVGQVAS